MLLCVALTHVSYMTTFLQTQLLFGEKPGFWPDTDIQRIGFSAQPWAFKSAQFFRFVQYFIKNGYHCNLYYFFHCYYYNDDSCKWISDGMSEQINMCKPQIDFNLLRLAMGWILFEWAIHQSRWWESYMTRAVFFTTFLVT